MFICADEAFDFRGILRRRRAGADEEEQDPGGGGIGEDGEGGGRCADGREFAVRGAETRRRADVSVGVVREQAVESDGAGRAVVGADVQQGWISQPLPAAAAVPGGGARSRRFPAALLAPSLAAR